MFLIKVVNLLFVSLNSKELNMHSVHTMISKIKLTVLQINTSREYYNLFISLKYPGITLDKQIIPFGISAMFFALLSVSSLLDISNPSSISLFNVLISTGRDTSKRDAISFT